MSIEYISIALGLVGIGLFFFGFALGQKSSITSSEEKIRFIIWCQISTS